MIINHNLIAVNTYNKFNKANTSKCKAMEKLSSGLRINRAGDDAAGLAISEKMRGQIRGLEQAGRNIQDGISLIQTADGALNETQSILQRMRELSVQSSNGTLTDEDRSEVQMEVEQLKRGIDSIANNTEFNGIKLLDGSISGFSISNVPTTVVQTPASNSKCIANLNIPSNSNVISGVNDQFSFDLDGVNNLVVINAGTYNSTSLINEINSKLSSSVPVINATATYISGNLEIKNNISGSLNTINNLSGSLINSLSIQTTNGYVSSINFNSCTMLDYDYSGSSYPYTNVYNPNINIQAGVNDTLTFKLDGVLHSITIPPQNYAINFNDGSINNFPITSQLINNLNNSFNSASIPIEAYFMHANGDILNGDYGTSLYFRVKPSTTGIHTLGEFGGNAKSELFNEFYIGGWTHQDSSTVVSGNATGYPATVLGSKDISSGVNIDNTSNILNLDVNGVSQNITLTIKSYTASELLTELNSALLGVTASYSGGKLLLRNLVVGSTSTITNVSGNSLSTLFTNISPIVGTDTVYKNAMQKVPDSSKICNLQIGANANEFSSVIINDCRTSNLNIKDVYVDTYGNAQNAIYKIDNAINKISTERSKCGAYQNSLEHILNNVFNYAENLTSAEARIRDTDMAKEIMEMTKQSILEQSSQSLLKQAQQLPESILQLLKG